MKEAGVIIVDAVIEITDVEIVISRVVIARIALIRALRQRRFGTTGKGNEAKKTLTLVNAAL